jgi:hypothetical protein
VRPPEIILYVLFPLFIAVGIALGMDAVSAVEFSYARAAFAFAAAVTIGLTLWWFYQADFTRAVALMLFFSVGSIGVAWWAGMKWLDLKEHVFCYIGAVPDGDGIYRLTAWSVGPYPAINVRISISNPTGDFSSNPEIYDVGDVEPLPARRLISVPPIPHGNYKIRIQTRSGYFFETLAVAPGLITRVDMSRVIFNEDGSSVLMPLR